MSVEYFPVADDITGRSLTLPPGLFVLNRANRKFVYGQRKRIGSSWIIFLIVAIILVICAAIVISTSGTAGQLRQIEEAGIKAGGVVTDGRSIRGRSTSYYITYRYNVDGVSYDQEQRVSSSTYNGLYIGDEVTVRYLPDSPAVSALSGDDLDNTILAENDVMALVAIIVGGIFIVALLWIDHRNRVLSHRGQLLPGEIINATGRRGSKGAYTVTLHYRFRTPSGEISEKKSTANRPDLRKMPLPPPGTPVLVLYVHDKSLRLM
jgi:hypothetical protein